MNKHKLLQEELKGLAVEWKKRYSDKVEQALVNGHLIIWHRRAYTEPDEPTVEVYFKDAEDVEGHVPIEGLRKRVE